MKRGFGFGGEREWWVIVGEGEVQGAWAGYRKGKDA